MLIDYSTITVIEQPVVIVETTKETPKEPNTECEYMRKVFGDKWDTFPLEVKLALLKHPYCKNN